MGHPARSLEMGNGGDTVWQNRPYRRFLAGRAQSYFGTAVSESVVPIIAATTLGASARSVGVLVSLQIAARLIVQFFAAITAEGSRRTLAVLRLTELLRGGAVGLVPCLWAFGALSFAWLCVSATLGAGLAGAFNAYAAPYVVQLVDPRHLESANGASAAARSTADVAGPGIAGLLLRVFAAPVLLVIDAVTYLSGFLLLTGLPNKRINSEDVEQTATVAGFAVIFKTRLSASFNALLVISLANSAILSLLVVYATRHFGLSPSLYSLLLGVGAAGGIVGAASIGPVSRHIDGQTLRTISVVLLVSSLWVLPLAPRTGGAGAGALAYYELAGSLGGAWFAISLISSVPRLVPPDMISRAMAAATILPELAGLAGALLGALLASHISLRSLFFGFAAFSCLAVPAVLWPSGRVRQKPRE